MKKVVVECLETGMKSQAEVLRHHQNMLRVVIAGTTIPINLTRVSQMKPFIGRLAGLEFVVRSII